jgi:hypothetical protein
MGMGYGDVLLVLSIMLAARFVFCDRASHRSKCLVGGIFLGTIMIPRWFPSVAVPAEVIQFGTGIYIILFLTATADDAEADTAKADEPGAPQYPFGGK